MIPQRPPLVVDLHTHILPAPERWPNLVQKYGYPGFVELRSHRPCCAQMLIDGRVFREIDANAWDPAVRLRECDSAGVRIQVLSTVPVMFAYWAKAADGLDLSRWLNDHISEVIARHPGRFVGLGTLPMQDPDRACDELERCVNDLGLAGVQIGSHVNRWNLSEPALFPVFERAASLGAAVFVHPWDMMGQDEMSRYWLPWLVGMPAETARAICSIIFGGVLERLPSLRIGFAHGGGSFPGTIGRIEHGFACRPDLCAVDNPVAPRAYLADASTGRPARFYVDSLTHDAQALRAVIALMGIERVAMGSDYPFPLGEAQPGRLIREMPDLTPAQQSRLLSGTALEFLGLASHTLELAAALA